MKSHANTPETVIPIGKIIYAPWQLFGITVLAIVISLSCSIFAAKPAAADSSNSGAITVTPNTIPEGATASGQVWLASAAKQDTSVTLAINPPDKGVSIPNATVVVPVGQSTSVPFAVTVAPGTVSEDKLASAPFYDVVATANGNNINPARVTIDTLSSNRQPSGTLLACSIIAGLGVPTLIILVIAGICKNKSYFTNLMIGDDGRPSTSKWQHAIWTFVILASYISIGVTQYVLTKQVNLAITINVALVLGISTAARVLASAITAYQSPGPNVPDEAMPNSPFPLSSWRYLFCADNDKPDLGKWQMMSWTIVAVAIYLASTWQELAYIPASRIALPSIDDALVVLMGLASGAYLGGKLVKGSNAVITGLSPSHGKAGTAVVITGSGFGAVGGDVLLNSSPVPTSAWSNSSVTFGIPSNQPAGTPVVAVRLTDQTVTEGSTLIVDP